MDDQVLLDAMGADAGFERHILGRRRRGLADIGRGKNELAEGDVADFAASGHGGNSCDGRAGDVSRPGKPVTNPLSALFLCDVSAGTAVGKPSRDCNKRVISWNFHMLIVTRQRGGIGIGILHQKAC